MSGVNVRRAIKSALDLLSRRDQRLLGISVAIQMATSVLDLLGVLLIGIVGALAVTTIQSQPPPSQVMQVVEFLGLETVTPQGLVLMFAGAAAAVLLAKSIVSSYLTRRVLIFLANRQALVSARLIRELLSQPLTFVQRRSSQETSFALIGGAGAATLGVLGYTVIGLSELSLLILMGGLLLFYSPWVALGAIAFFAALALLLQRVLGTWATRVGGEMATTEISSLNAVQEALGTYREITVASRRPMYVDRIQGLRWEAAKAAAGWQFINILPKYIFEAALVVGGFLLAGVLFATQDSVAAVSTLALFLAAGSRVMPSLLRLQGAALGLRGTAATAAPTFELAAALDKPTSDIHRSTDYPNLSKLIRSHYPGFEPTIQLDHVTFAYDDGTAPAVDGISLCVSAGQSIALVGRSGAGKSTLADLILGVLTPCSGVVRLGGLPPEESVTMWPGAVSYVPQEVVLASGTVRGNVALGLPSEAIDDDLVWEALERAHLAKFLKGSREGLETIIGERGVKLSGGQRQRLGIARALYTRPKLLVLDEATSALDAETEESISATIRALEGDVTTVIIAHRLSTVRSADMVLYLEGGKVVGQGTFGEVVRQVPALEKQASLMGIDPR